MPTANLSEQESVNRKWEEYADNFEEPLKEKSWAKSGLWRLVGNGKQTDDSCGNFAGYLICDNAEGHNHTDLYGVNWDGYAEIHLKHKSCFSYNCPVCYLSWAVQGAHRINDKLDSLGIKYGLADHIVLSLPEESFNPNEGLREYFSPTDKDFDKLLKYAVKALRNRGIVGGCMIFHGFRYADKKEAEQKKVPFGWRWSPHFHILGFIRQKKQFYNLVKEYYPKDGLIVNLKDKRQSVFGTAWYQLNHASIQFEAKHFEVARWFGDTHDPNAKKMRENSKKIRELKKSSSIEAPMLIQQLQADNKALKIRVEEVTKKEHKKHCSLCGRELKKGEYYGLRKDLKPSLQDCRIKLIRDVKYKKGSRKIFYDKIIDEVNGIVNWAGK